MWEVFRTLGGRKNVQLILGTRLFCSTHNATIYLDMSHVILTAQIERKVIIKEKKNTKISHTWGLPIRGDRTPL